MSNYGNYDGKKLKSKDSQIKTSCEILFGWHKFNTWTLAFLIVLFLIWSVTFFTLYKPKPEESHHPGMDPSPMITDF